ncbi:MAG: hypothetical protein M1834_001127 [Cirrosporium novae-zelandiae]|nr:MAG: hypothetical protein M1834_001127 [Cirrosporium novae-zelandiae]
MASGDDFANNLFFDLVSLLALFGENFAKQFLSIITAMVGAIRVAGPSWFRAVIGRARENIAAAELEFMSSTSHEVCELWNGQAIVRTMGKEMVKQIIYLEGRENEKEYGLFTLTEAKKHNYMEENGLRGTKAKSLYKMRHPISTDSESLQNTNSKPKSGIRPDRYQKPSQSLSLQSETKTSKHCHSGRASNISLNLHIEKELGKGNIITKSIELVIIALLGILLQSGVVVFSAFTAYNPRLSTNLGGPVKPYAFPLLAVGTVVLVLGMAICSIVIEQSTEEYTWTVQNAEKVNKVSNSRTDQIPSKAEPLSLLSKASTTALGSKILSDPTHNASLTPIKTQISCKETDQPIKMRVFWLQKDHTVSDQSFNSFFIMARSTRQSILTSRRKDDSDLTQYTAKTTQNQAMHHTKHSRNSDKIYKFISNALRLQTLAIARALTGLSGFVLQFEAFRGMSWVCSIAQLIALLLMTILRAYVRRNLLDRPHTEGMDEGYEMDWLALRVGSCPDYLKDIAGGLPDLSRCANCGKMYKDKNSSERDQLHCQVPEWEIFSKPGCLAIPGSFKNPRESTPEGSAIPQEVVNARKRLAELTRWIGPAYGDTISIVNAIEKVMNRFFPLGEQSRNHFVWFLDARVFNEQSISDELNPFKPETGKIKFVVEKDEKGMWKADSREIEAALSLWIYHFRKRGQQVIEIQETSHEVSDWLRPTESSMEMEPFRVLGTYTNTLETDLRFWIRSDIVSALERRVDVSENDVKSQQSLMLGFCNFGGISKEPEGEKKLILGVRSNIQLKHFLAQHIFSAFMWAIADQIPSSRFNETTVEDSAKGEFDFTHNKFLKLKNEKLRGLTRELEGTGLGTLEEMEILLIPPLSLASKLPNKILVEHILERAKSHENGHHWESASGLYCKLLDHMSSIDVYKVILSVINFLSFTLNATFPEDAEAYDNEREYKEENRSRILETLQDSKRFLAATCDLKVLYKNQNRETEYSKIIGFDELKTCEGGNYGCDQNPHDKFEYTDLHTEIINLGQKEKDSSENLQELLKKYVDRKDILGWLPLHYAVTCCSKELISKVLEKWRDGCNQKDSTGRTPLHYAVMRGEKKVVELLLKECTKIEQASDGMLPWHLAAKFGKTEVMETFLTQYRLNKLDINILDKWGRSALHLAASGGHVIVVKQLLEATASVNGRDKFNRTALHVAAYYRYVEVVEELCKAGADIELTESRGHIALVIAAEGKKDSDQKKAHREDQNKNTKTEQFEGDKPRKNNNREEKTKEYENGKEGGRYRGGETRGRETARRCDAGVYGKRKVYR